MRKTFALLILVPVLAGCAGSRKGADAELGLDTPERSWAGEAPAYALPGVPLRSGPAAKPSEAKQVKLLDTRLEDEPQAKPAAEPAAKPEPETAEAATAAEPAAEAAAAPAPAAAPAARKNTDLDFHVESAKKYFAKKKYRSAAAEYAAALPYVPAGDALAVNVLERQGAMLLKAGENAKAKERFLAAIKKAGELNSSGDDLANAYTGLGYCQEKENKAAEAIASYEKARGLTSSKAARARLAGAIQDLKKAK